jgi:hypothetical protein
MLINTQADPRTGTCDSRWWCPAGLKHTPPFEIHSCLVTFLWYLYVLYAYVMHICICYAYTLADPNTEACDSGWGCPGGPDSPFEIHSPCYSGLLDIYSFGLHNLYLKNDMISTNVWRSRIFPSLKFCINKGTINILEFLHSQFNLENCSIWLKYCLVQIVFFFFCIFTCCSEYKSSIYGQQYGCVLYSFLYLYKCW